MLELATIVQLSIMESLGILVFRTERAAKEPGQVWVYRLACLEEAAVALGREQLRDHAMEATRGATLYAVSHPEHSVLRLAVAVGRRILVYRWKHQEEWLTFTEDTVQGFQLLQEVQVAEVPLVLTLLERREQEPGGQVLPSSPLPAPAGAGGVAAGVGGGGPGVRGAPAGVGAGARRPAHPGPRALGGRQAGAAGEPLARHPGPGHLQLHQPGAGGGGRGVGGHQGDPLALPAPGAQGGGTTLPRASSRPSPTCWPCPPTPSRSGRSSCKASPQASLWSPTTY